jgi:Glycosyl hydrolase family 79, N-terminal domain
MISTGTHSVCEGILFAQRRRIRMPKIHQGSPKCQAWLVSTLLIALACPAALAAGASINPASMARIGAIDERFQSYNIEMVEVTGGRFWKPYGPKPHRHFVRAPHMTAQAGPNGPAGMSSNLYEYRPPIDLTNSRLRRLAAALAPAYLRVSGTWANATHFAISDRAPSAPPSGFNAILSHPQWQGVLNFSQAVGAPIVTSFAVSQGTRDAAGIWTPDEARRLLAYTRSLGGTIAAAEFMNEPDISIAAGMPAGYDAAAYGRDFKTFHTFVKGNFPEIIILGPGTVGETPSAAALLAASGPGGVDAISYHHYGTLSERCGVTGAPGSALSEGWLSRTDHTLAFYRFLRDKFEPGKPIWLTETAEAACGGNRWDASFLDTFRYLDQLGRLARAGVQVVMHNTLAASDYGLLDEKTLAPRPNYWGAVLWRRLMGRIVLDSGVPIHMGLHVYAHCQRGISGGVSLLIINTDRNAPHTLMLPTTSERYTLDAESLRDKAVRLNGLALRLSSMDDLPRIESLRTEAGTLTFAPATITFLTAPKAGNNNCQ